jgi:hypothetical protein
MHFLLFCVPASCAERLCLLMVAMFGRYLQRWPVSKRVNSSKADADDATLIEPVELAAA